MPSALRTILEKPLKLDQKNRLGKVGFLIFYRKILVKLMILLNNKNLSRIRGIILALAKLNF